MRAWMLIFILLFSCKIAKREYLPKSDLKKFDNKAISLMVRLQLEHLEGGYVISRNESDFSPEHQGDSLLWSGIALGSLPCETGEEIFRNLRYSIKERNGALVRMDPLPDKYIKNSVSRDGAIGFLYGIVFRAINCPSDWFRAMEALDLNLRWIERSNGKLGDGPNLTSVSRYTYKRVAEFFELPHSFDAHMLDFELGIYGGAYAIKQAKRAAYPVHLSTLQIIILDAIEKPITIYGKDNFCKVTKGMQLGLTDLYCARKSAKLLLEEFKLNEYEYKWQRAAWENPDGKGILSPAVDWLIIYDLGRIK